MKEAVNEVLLVDAENAFNSINRKVLLHNTVYRCPELTTFAIAR